MKTPCAGENPGGMIEKKQREVQAVAISLWGVRLDRPLTGEERAALVRLLPPERLERLKKVSDRENWREPLAAYGLLLLALRRTHGFPSIPYLSYRMRGKPDLEEYPEVQFSLSHTAGAVLVGLSEAALGVDIEHRRPLNKRTLRKLAERGETEEHYLRDWVRYEALVKRSGSGVAIHHHLSGREPVQDVEILPDCYAAVSGIGPITIQYQGTLDDLLRDLEE